MWLMWFDPTLFRKFNGMKFWSSYTKKLVDVDISHDSVLIFESYRIKSVRGMVDLLKDIKSSQASVKSIPTQYRTLAGMVIEWRARNLLYALGIKRNITRDLDIVVEVRPLYKVMYFVLSMFYFRF